MGMKLHGIVLAVGLLSAATVPQTLMAQTASADAGGYFTVQQYQGAATVSIGGTVIPYKEVAFTAQIPGRVRQLAGREGDTFKKGAMLVTLDDSGLIAKRNAALAQLATADAQLRATRIQYNRELWSPQSKQSMGGMGMPNLFDQMFSRPMENFTGNRNSGVERRADLYASGVQITQAQNSILAAQSQIQGIDAKLRDATSFAPFDGVILKKHIEVGDTVQPGQPLLVFADVGYLQISIDIPARLRPGLQEEMIMQAELDVGARVVPVRVAQIYPMADAQRHTVKVKFDLPQGVSAPGMYAKVKVPDFSTPAQSYPVIPLSAVRYNGSLPGVYVEGAEGSPELRLIRVGEQLEDGFVSILSGIRVGERILRNPGIGVASSWGSRSEN